MFRITPICLILVLCVSTISADEPKLVTRPITEAESVLAVYGEDWGLASKGDTSLIFAVWPDGHIVWSGDRINGGAPYRAGEVDPKKITGLLARFDKDGLFANKKLKEPKFGADSKFITLSIRSGKKQLEMSSWHEWSEESGEAVADHTGIRILEGQSRLEALSKSPADYLFYRFVWSETRGKLNDMIPRESRETKGKPVKKAGILTWQEPAAGLKSNDAGSPLKK